MTNNHTDDYALKYATKIAFFLCSQNMGVQDIYRACNLSDIPGKNDAEKFSNKFPIFPGSDAPKSTSKELFFAETRKIQREHAEREGMDLFVLGLVFLLAIACIALIVAAPYLAIAFAGAVAISEFRKPLMLYFIVEGAVGLAQACGFAATIQLDRSKRGEELLRELTQYSPSPFESIEDLKAACKECNLEDTIQTIYDHLSNLPDKTTEHTDFINRGHAERTQARKLMGMFASHHQGLFGWYIPWLTGTEAKGDPATKRRYNKDIERVFSATSQIPTTSRPPVSADSITLREGTPSHNNPQSSERKQGKKKGKEKGKAPVAKK